MFMTEIQLDKQTFKALASSTRLEILKLLHSRKHTQSEIAEALEMSAPTVKEHLSALQTAGLIVRYEEGRKWKYFGLTDKARGIFEPERTKILFVFIALIVSVAGGIIFAVKSLFSGASFGAAKMAAASQEGMLAAAPATAQQSANSSVTVLIAFCVAAAFFLTVLIVLLLHSWQRRKLLAEVLTKR